MDKKNTVKEDNRDITKFSENIMIAEEVHDVHSQKDSDKKNVKPANEKTSESKDEKETQKHQDDMEKPTTESRTLKTIGLHDPVDLNKHDKLETNTKQQLDRRKGSTSTDRPISLHIDSSNTKSPKKDSPVDNSVDNKPHKNNVSANVNYQLLKDSTESDILLLKGQKNTARVRLLDETTTSAAYLLSGDPSSIESLDDKDFRLRISKCRCMPKRYVLAILSFFGFFNVYCLRVDLSVALVAMTSNHTRVKYDGSEYWVPAEFNWDRQLQGHILAAFYYGYLITQIPGGYIAARFGGKNLFGIAILLSAMLTLITPLASREHWSFLFILRFIEGLCEGCIYPAMYAIWSRWAPPLERAKLVTIPHSGSYSGSVAGTLLAGYLCELCGWAWVFYLFGIFALIWVVIWQIMVSDSPEEDHHISTMEKNMILESLQDDQTSHLLKGSPPWIDIFTSLPFLAILVAHTAEGWGFGTMQTGLPKYLSEAMNFRLSKTGEYTATSYLVMGITVFLSGQLADFIRQRGWLTATYARKVFTFVGFIANAFAFVLSIQMESPEAAVITIIVGSGIESLAWAGFAINHLDIAPRYASLLFGITNTCATIPNILSPVIVGAVTADGTRKEWEAVFYISAVTFAVGAIFYWVFGSAERQPWAEDNENTSLREIEKEE